MTGLHLGRLVEIDREHGRLITSDQHAFRAAPAVIPPDLAVGHFVRIYFEERDGEAWVLEVRRA